MAERNPELLNERGRADLWFHIALAYETKQDRTKAIEALDRAIDTFTEDRRLHFRRAQNWRAIGECSKAIPDFSRSIVQHKNPSAGYTVDSSILYQAYLGRGSCQEKLGYMKLARDDYDLALALDPDSQEARTARRRVFGPSVEEDLQPARAVAGAPDPKPKNVETPRAKSQLLQKRMALVIGNSQYLYTNGLPNAVNDAADVAAALKDKGYKIYGYPRVNMHREDMFAALDEFSRVAADADVALVWYAGHGQQMSDPGEPARNWLFPVDYKGGTDLDRGAIPLTKLLSAAQAGKRLKVVVVDACRNTTLQSGARAARGFKAEPRSDMVIVYSTSAGSIAEDGDPSARNSPFAAAFLETFKSHGAIDVRQFFGGVSEGVRRRTQSSQAPQQPELMSNLNTLDTLALAP
jgi:tetratricopeptide (TPR) repeat protein